MKIGFFLFIGFFQYLNKTRLHHHLQKCELPHDTVNGNKKPSNRELMDITRKTFRYNQGGYDERHMNSSDEGDIENIFDDMVKMDLLKILQNESFSEYYKIMALEEYSKNNIHSKYAHDLQAGGLFKEWEHGNDW
jgi:hypothetical protein